MATYLAPASFAAMQDTFIVTNSSSRTFIYVDTLYVIIMYV